MLQHFLPQQHWRLKDRACVGLLGGWCGGEGLKFGRGAECERMCVGMGLKIRTLVQCLVCRCPMVLGPMTILADNAEILLCSHFCHKTVT